VIESAKCLNRREIEFEIGRVIACKRPLPDGRGSVVVETCRHDCRHGTRGRARHADRNGYLILLYYVL
jgi:hypothetical protein